MLAFQESLTKHSFLVVFNARFVAQVSAGLPRRNPRQPNATEPAQAVDFG